MNNGYFDTRTLSLLLAAAGAEINMKSVLLDHVPLITAFDEMVKTDEWMKSQTSQLAKETCFYLQNTFNLL